MARRSIFYSFHFANDVMRVQQIRNIGALDGNEPVSANDWESVRRRGDAAVQRWITDNMNYRQCVVVLVGTATAHRPWVKHEIRNAWEDNRGLFGIHIHNLKCPRSGVCAKGPNPFDQFTFPDGSRLSGVVDCYDPNPLYAYTEIATNMEAWVERAIAQRR